MNAEKYIANKRARLRKMEDIHRNCSESHQIIRNRLNIGRHSNFRDLTPSGESPTARYGEKNVYGVSRDTYEFQLKEMIIMELASAEKHKKTGIYGEDPFWKENRKHIKRAQEDTGRHKKNVEFYSKLLEDSLSTPYVDRTNISAREYVDNFVNGVLKFISDINITNLHHVSHCGKHKEILKRLDML